MADRRSRGRQSLACMQRSVDALKPLQVATRLHPTNVTAWLVLAETLGFVGEYVRATQCKWKAAVLGEVKGIDATRRAEQLMIANWQGPPPLPGEQTCERR